MRILLTVVLLTLAAGSVAADETVRVETVEQLRQAVRQAQPGTTIAIAPGEYAGDLYLENVRGEEGRPITLTGAEPDDPPVFVGGRQGIHLQHPRHVTLAHIVVEGTQSNGINIDDGGTMRASATGIVLRHVTVRDVRMSGNHDGIKLSGLSDFRIENCLVERWGDGAQGIDMVGCHRGHVTGTTLRDGGATATGITMKGGSERITIERCHFDNAGARAVNVGGSTGMAFFRPQPPPPYEARAITVTRCTFVGADTPVAFVGVDGARFTWNTVYRPRRWAARILQETTGEDFVPSRDGVYAHNLVVFRSDELRTAVNVGPGTQAESFTFAGNWWYCEDAPDRSEPRLPVAEREGVYGRDPQLRDPENGDLRPAADSPARQVGAHAEDRARE